MKIETKSAGGTRRNRGDHAAAANGFPAGGPAKPGHGRSSIWFAWVLGLVGLVSASDATKVFRTPDGMVAIHPGSFQMGSPESEPGRDDRDGPVHVVTIPYGYWLGRYEVTQAGYLSLMNTNPSAYKGDPRCPVESVSWESAMEYCRRLNAREQSAGRLPEGYVYRLPTEAEWEYACRAGTTNRYSFGDETRSLSDYAWWGGGPEAGHPHPVGLKKPNPWGLYDMHGNVFEYVLEWFAAYPGGPAFTDPPIHVMRGGAFYCPAEVVRSACRTHSMPPNRGSNLSGFRVALAPSAPLDALQNPEPKAATH